jgi:uncharacterized protein (DUF488 family)
MYTSYYANIENLPDKICPISIAGKAPESYKGVEFKKLAPKLSFWKVWEQTKDNDYYIEQFNKLVLNTLDPKTIYDELITISNGKIPCLICYEKPGEFCHRHLVAEWLQNNCNIKVEEYTESNKLF